MAPVQVFDREEQPPNPLWKYNVLTQVLCLVVSGVLLLMRCYVRLGYSTPPKSWLLEDWLVVVSFLGMLAFSILVSLMANHGAGAHIETIPNHRHMVSIQWNFWISSLLYGPVILGIKLSIILLYRRIFVTTRHSFIWYLVNGVGVLCILYYVLNTFIRIFACTPMRRSWDFSAPGQCLSHILNIVVSGSLNIFTDVVLLAIPIIASWNLRVNWWKKFRFCALLSFGAMAPAASAVGFAARFRLQESEDFTFIYLQIHLCVMAEMTVGMICICLSLIPPLFIKAPKEDLRQYSTSFPSARRRRVDPIESLLRQSTELDNVDLDIPLPAEPTRYRSGMVARREVNMLNENNRAVADEGEPGTTNILEFLALAGRIDDDVRGDPGHELQELRGVHMRNDTNTVSNMTGEARATD